MAVAITTANLFDGKAFRGPRTVLVEAGRVAELRAPGALPAGVDAHVDLGEALLAPGFVDVQVNGGGGVMFNSDQSVAALRTMVNAHLRYGTTTLMPTVITDTPEVMQAAAGAVRAALEQGLRGLGGIHFEGPCLNPQRKGVHDPARMSGLTGALEALYGTAGLGRVLVTLAPEQFAPGEIARLAQAGLRLSAGHSTASAETMARAVAEGLTGVTHLFNAMPPMEGRAPGVVGTALASDALFAGLIVDLVHVAPQSARAAIRAKGPDRVMLVSDAMGTVGSDDKRFTLYGREIYEVDGRCALADGTLAGSALDMMTAVRNTHRALGLPLEAALEMTSLTPARFLGLESQIGHVAPGALANLVAIAPGPLTVARSFLSEAPLAFAPGPSG